jgi:protein TonB
VSALAYSTNYSAGSGALVDRLRAKFAPLATVLALHAVLFYFVYSGLLNRMVQVALPDAVYVTFVAPPAAPKTIVPPTPKVAAQLPPAVIPPPNVQISIEPAISTAPPVAAAPEKAPAPVAAAPAAPAPVAAATPKTITSGVEYIQPPQPVYPPQSRRMGEQGKVVLRVLVNEKGLADQVVVQTSSGSTRLDEAGRAAAQRALFKPHLEDGRPVPVFVIVPLNFTLAS